MEIEEFAQPIDHQPLQALSLKFNLSLFLLPHPPQIGDEMEEGFARILKKRLEILTIHDQPYICCVIQDFKTLSSLFDLHAFLVTSQLKAEKRVGRFFCKNLEAKPLSVKLNRFAS